MMLAVRFTISFFTAITILPAVAWAGNPLIAGYISPVPDAVLAALTHEKQTPPVVGGIRLTYHGYTDYSNNDGYFNFPKYHPDETLRIVISREIDYNLLKKTVAEIKLPTQDPAKVAIYRVTKQKASLKEASENQSSRPKENKSAPETTAPAKETKAISGSDQVDEDKPLDQQEAWFFKIEPQELVGGISQRDLLIECLPGDVYINTQEDHYTEESTNFIMPSSCIYLLKTPEAPELKDTDAMNQAINTSIESDTVKAKGTETDSQGNTLPDIARSALRAV